MSAPSALNAERSLTHVLLIRVELGLSGPLLHEALEERPGVLAMEHVVVPELKAFAGRAIERLNRRVS